MILAGAMILDACLGEPAWLWSRLNHPAVLIGNFIGWAERRFNDGDHRKVKGVALTAVLVLGGWAVGAVLSSFGWVVEIVAVAILLAQKSLADHVAKVAEGLRMSLPQGRRDVAMIVGRDTGQMTAPDVARGAIESAAENFSDGVIAPAFWFAVAGLPGILIYKAINTADSMVGYKTPQLADFGWASARLDDVLNWLPARLTGLVFAARFGQLSHWSDIRAEAAKHRSPNAGWPEAALARALGVAVSGPRWYHGQLRDIAWVHPKGRKDAHPRDIDAAVRCLWLAWAAFLAITLVLGASGLLPVWGGSA